MNGLAGAALMGLSSDFSEGLSGEKKGRRKKKHSVPSFTPAAASTPPLSPSVPCHRGQQGRGHGVTAASGTSDKAETQPPMSSSGIGVTDAECPPTSRRVSPARLPEKDQISRALKPSKCLPKCTPRATRRYWFGIRTIVYSVVSVPSMRHRTQTHHLCIRLFPCVTVEICCSGLR